MRGKIMGMSFREAGAATARAPPWFGACAPPGRSTRGTRGRRDRGASNAYAWASLYLPPQHGFSLGASSARRIVAQP